MIIYKENINTFLQDAVNDNLVVKLCLELEHKKGIVPSQKEKESWRTTLTKVAKDVEVIKNKNEQYILLEFVVPNHRKRIDVVLIGADDRNDNLAIIELKGWSEIKAKDNTKLLFPNTSYGFHGLSHPAYEALDYYHILKDEYSEITQQFEVFPISYLPNYDAPAKNILNDKKYDDVIQTVNLFWKGNREILIDFFKEKFKNAIEISKVNYLNHLEYKPSLSLLEHAKDKFEKIHLIGSQRDVFETINYFIDVNQPTNKKTAFIISGPAGSGKSIIAFKLLLKLISEKYETRLMIPGIEFREAVKRKFGDNIFREKIYGAYSKCQCDYAIVDEAHKATANGTTKQFYNELLERNNNVILFLDDLQVINKKGITKKEFINIASKHNFACVQLQLEEQFRNAGDASYIDWLQYMIFNKQNNQHKFVTNYFNFKILDGVTFNQMYKSMYETHNVRLVSFFTQRWDLNNLIDNIHPTPTVKIANHTYTWNPNNEWLKQFKENNPDIKIPNELYNLCEKQNFLTQKKGYQYVAYFNTIQGSEFDYIFVHVPKLFYLNDNNELDVDFSYLKDVDGKVIKEMQSQLWLGIDKIKNETKRIEKLNLNKLYFKNRLFICLTRGLKGAFLYFEDDKLAKFFQQHLGEYNENNSSGCNRN